ncbi:MAG: hypothetical protein OXE77_07160 [Flavobacteriaceae bacterium]|nr:hypothetical protein [Flavobacteriaceae bacterium]MCY4268348.1 hypothetical protein [Flavobacteriaceae bacterium]MCY4299197.1 hypothetical protein [Flavobacteriaceae bacterium]
MSPIERLQDSRKHCFDRTTTQQPRTQSRRADRGEVREKFLDNQLFETLEDLKEQRTHGF